jgi:hypothetical protein
MPVCDADQFLAGGYERECHGWVTMHDTADLLFGRIGFGEKVNLEARSAGFTKTRKAFTAQVEFQDIIFRYLRIEGRPDVTQEKPVPIWGPGTYVSHHVRQFPLEDLESRVNLRLQPGNFQFVIIAHAALLDLS